MSNRNHNDNYINNLKKENNKLRNRFQHTKKELEKNQKTLISLRSKGEWKEAKSRKEKRTYYYHTKTGETSWKRPPDMDLQQKQGIKMESFTTKKHQQCINCGGFDVGLVNDVDHLCNNCRREKQSTTGVYCDICDKFFIVTDSKDNVCNHVKELCNDKDQSSKISLQKKQYDDDFNMVKMMIEGSGVISAKKRIEQDLYMLEDEYKEDLKSLQCILQNQYREDLELLQQELEEVYKQDLESLYQELQKDYEEDIELLQNNYEDYLKWGQDQHKEEMELLREKHHEDLKLLRLEMQEQHAQDLESLQDYETCKICMEKPRNVVIKKCGHLCMCIDCANSLNLCPLCRITFQRGDLLRVFQS